MYKTNMTDKINLPAIFARRPDSEAVIKGAPDYPDIHGKTAFYRTVKGVLVFTEVWGLPVSDSECNKAVFAYHIHSGPDCTGNSTDPFADTDGHYNPKDCPHPYHAGDMPPLWGNNGYAFSVFLTDRFTVKEIIGKTVIIHRSPDDFMTQPSGNSGAKIACGAIF